MIANQNTLKLAYELIKSKKGNMTRGVSKETLYGISLSVFERLSNKKSVPSIARRKIRISSFPPKTHS